MADPTGNTGRTLDLTLATLDVPPALASRLVSEGLSLRHIQDVAEIPPGCRVVMCGSRRVPEDLLRLAHEGGVVLCSFAGYRGIPFSVSADAHVTPLAGLNCHWVFQRQGLRWQRPSPVLVTARVGRGVLLAYPVELEEALQDRSRYGDVAFSLGLQGTDGFRLDAVREKVSVEAKCNALRFLRWLLHHAYALAGLPLVRLWPFPFPYRSVFNYRFDCDGGGGAGIHD